MLFSEMDLSEKIQQAIARIGYTEATPIQEQTITSFLTGKHIVGQSQTGTGKTAAFCLPILNAVDPTSRKVQALILCPTRELATQTQEEVYKLSFGLIGIKSVCVYGGSNVWKQKERIDAGAQIVVGTPGRVIDMIERRMLDVSALNYLVLDEADRMLDMGFVDDVEWIWKQAHAIKQVMSFSATITNELRDLLHEHIGTDYASIKIQQEIIVDKIDHSFMMVDHGSKEQMLDKFLKDHEDQKVVIFTQMKMHTMQLADALKALGHNVFELHGDMRQYDRNRTIKAYKEGEAKILIATDVASRGLNLNDIALVINYDVPQDPESYIHRVGRTGRAGKEGKAITMVDSREMRLLDAIEKRNKIRIKQIDENGNEVKRAEARTTGGRFGGGGSR
jgi:ATP-dependent RNA helicase DeaD